MLGITIAPLSPIMFNSVNPIPVLHPLTGWLDCWLQSSLHFLVFGLRLRRDTVSCRRESGVLETLASATRRLLDADQQRTERRLAEDEVSACCDDAEQSAR